MNELKPCPYCGVDIVPVRINSEISHYQHPYGKCYLAGGIIFKENIDLWNTRADTHEEQ